MFNTVGIFIKSADDVATAYFNELDRFLQDGGIRTVEFTEPELDSAALSLDNPIDLAVVIGGDGTMLRVSRLLAPSGIPVVGVNRGRLGFLTEISASSMLHDIERILNGDFFIQNRTMLSCQISQGSSIVDQTSALNDIVIGRGRIGRLIEFEIKINGKLVTHTRGDGLIISTPTGSTAYALAADGPIIDPALEVITLVPICPHTLSHRPLVVSGDSNIEVRLINPEIADVTVSVDGYTEYTIKNDERITITRSETNVKLVHLTDYSYYEALRSKLGWSNRLGGA